MYFLKTLVQSQMKGHILVLTLRHVFSSGPEGKKPKWDDFKLKKRELKQNRQQNDKKDSYDIVNRAKQVWEIVRR